MVIYVEGGVSNYQEAPKVMKVITEDRMGQNRGFFSCCLGTKIAQRGRYLFGFFFVWERKKNFSQMTATDINVYVLEDSHLNAHTSAKTLK